MYQSKKLDSFMQVKLVKNSIKRKDSKNHLLNCNRKLKLEPMPLVKIVCTFISTGTRLWLSMSSLAY